MTRHRFFFRLFAIFVLASIVGAGVSAAPRRETPPGDIVVADDFSEGSRGWLAGFSDYGLTNGNLEFLAEIRSVPDQATERKGFYLQGHNRSDDLFMFLKKPLTLRDGLEPNGTYRVEFDVELASDAQDGCFGAGGAPGEGVYLKVGTSRTEPVAVLDAADHLRLNVDKGFQSTDGKDGVVIGTIANGRPCTPGRNPFVVLHRRGVLPAPVKADATGQLWLFVGTDSAYEGLTGLYYTGIRVTLTPIAEN